MHKKHQLWGHVFLAVIVIILAIAIYESPALKKIFSSPESVKGFVLSFGYLSPLVMVLLQFLQSTFFPIPGGLIAVAAGYIFGAPLGILLCVVGLFFASTTSFWLAHWYGRPLVEKLVPERELRHFDLFFKKHGYKAIFIAYVLPIFPNDSMNFISGLLPIRYSRFILAAMTGLLPNVILLNVFGKEVITQGLSPTVIIIIAIYIILCAVFVFKEQIKRLLVEEIKFLEKEEKKLEKSIGKKL